MVGKKSTKNRSFKLGYLSTSIAAMLHFYPYFLANSSQIGINLGQAGQSSLQNNMNQGFSTCSKPKTNINFFHRST